jgi:hypothetical protein
MAKAGSSAVAVPLDGIDISTKHKNAEIRITKRRNETHTHTDKMGPRAQKRQSQKKQNENDECREGAKQNCSPQNNGG